MLCLSLLFPIMREKSLPVKVIMKVYGMLPTNKKRMVPITSKISSAVPISLGNSALSTSEVQLSF